MKTRYSTTCRDCGKCVSTKADEAKGAVRIRCRRCRRTNYAGASADKNATGADA